MSASRESTGTIDPAEVSKFEAMAAEWWDPQGKFKPLHMLNPCRLDYIATQIAVEFDRDLRSPRPFDGPAPAGHRLRRRSVVGTDGAARGRPWSAPMRPPRNIPVARIHAEQSGLAIDYRHAAAEDLVAQGERFDVVLNMEVVEHVSDPLTFLTACHDLLKPGGLMVCSTLNRNAKSFGMAIVGAEWVMRWLPKGTHDWSKFITPDELFDLLRRAGLEPVDRKGMVFNPLGWTWSLSARDLSVNYVTTSRRPA